MDASPEVLMVKTKGVICESDREHLRELMDTGTDLDEMLFAAWGMIITQGKDPQKFFTELS